MFNKLKSSLNPTHTPIINPAFGLFGIAGFLGFIGLVPFAYGEEIVTYPTFFFMFAFFGYFNLYYKGKMSGTLIDERFRHNASRASLLAYKIAFGFVIGVNALIIASFQFLTSHAALGILIAAIGFSLCFAVFFEQYLLYKYENEE